MNYFLNCILLHLQLPHTILSSVLSHTHLKIPKAGSWHYKPQDHRNTVFKNFHDTVTLIFSFAEHNLVKIIQIFKDSEPTEKPGVENRRST